MKRWSWLPSCTISATCSRRTTTVKWPAAVLRPYVSERTYWVIRQHGLFQTYYYAHHMGGDRNARDRYIDHPWYQDAVDFCHRWDQPSFDPDYDTLTLEFFEPAVRRVFAREPFSAGREQP
ncbi:hypothetical protein GBAR_LOCUS20428 [Geodia barretti]|uniref:Uncharacterized protein n=1 Tax=Geodia barretti TaxID=519541 RepID=A0AA35SW43_GEOBA|nr:hypothetical protein GBAR_LOCUS20428 [Geodia barretti]